MKRVSLSAILLLASSSLVGCTDAPVTGDEQNQTEVEQKSPQEYFAQFLYEKVERLDHRYPSSYQIEALGDTGLFFDLALYMRKDGSYTFDYSEMTQRTSSEFVVNTKLEGVAGTWNIIDDELQLSGLGIATAMSINDKDALSVEFTQDLSTPGLKGDTATLVMVKSTWGPDGND